MMGGAPPVVAMGNPPLVPAVPLVAFWFDGPDVDVVEFATEVVWGEPVVISV